MKLTYADYQRIKDARHTVNIMLAADAYGEVWPVLRDVSVA